MVLVPRGSDDGYEYRPARGFLVRANTPVEFHLLTSHVRLEDHQGDIIEIVENEMQRLPPIRTLLRFGKKPLNSDSAQSLPVRVSVKLTSLGILEIWLESEQGDHRWNLEFQLKSASGQDVQDLSEGRSVKDETFDLQFLEESKQIIRATFHDKEGLCAPSDLVDRLEKQLGISKQEWPPGILRALWEPLLDCATKRKLTPEHEIRWWNLVGYCLRPGYGFPLDDFRIKELWKVILGDFKSHSSLEMRIQQWICYRRIAGGLNKGQQTQLATKLLSDLFEKKGGAIEKIRKSDKYSYSEKIRALASFERIDSALKIKIGNMLVEKIINGSATGADYWALARIG